LRVRRQARWTRGSRQPSPEEFMKRALVLFAVLAGCPLTALAQSQADPVDVPAHETSAAAEASDLPCPGSELVAVEAGRAEAQDHPPPPGAPQEPAPRGGRPPTPRLRAPAGRPR